MMTQKLISKRPANALINVPMHSSQIRLRITVLISTSWRLLLLNRTSKVGVISVGQKLLNHLGVMAWDIIHGITPMIAAVVMKEINRLRVLAEDKNHGASPTIAEAEGESLSLLGAMEEDKNHQVRLITPEKFRLDQEICQFSRTSKLDKIFNLLSTPGKKDLE